MSIWSLPSRSSRSDKLENIEAQLTDEWFPLERAFFDDPAQLSAAICSRRAGKTRGLVRDLLRDALTKPGFRGLYLNSTRGEAEKLAWHGNRGDGIASLCRSMKINVKLDASKLTAHFPDTDAWIWLRGYDDEAELRKALGSAYHKVYNDEMQKVPPKLTRSIKEVFMPTLLDFGGQFRMTGTPSRTMSGMFYEVTTDEIAKRTPGWSVHNWTILDNPFFGATLEERYDRGIVGLQKLLGDPDLDSPIMQREAFGRWVREDAAYVYYVHKRNDVLYAPARLRDDGFPDIRRALGDLPFAWTSGFYALGVDIGYNPDPFAFVLVAWHPNDPVLYEVASWKKTHLDSDQQAAVLREVREVVPLGFIVADAGGPAKPTVKGWSSQFVERYGLPVLEAEKHNKHDAIAQGNTDIVAGHAKFREGGPLYEEMATLQWSHLVSGTGRLVEDPTFDNHCGDSWLYAQRHARQYRAVPAPVRLTGGARLQQELEELERDLLS